MTCLEIGCFPQALAVCQGCSVQHCSVGTGRVRSSSFMEALALADSRPTPAAGLLTWGGGHAVSKHPDAWKHSDFDI